MALTPQQTYLLTAFSAHVGWVLAVAFGGAVLFGLPLWVGMAVILAIAVLKETLLDPFFEGNPLWNGTFDSGAGDLVGYAVGSGVIMVIITTHVITFI